MKFHQYTAEEISAMHRALHRACGLPALSLTPADQSTWATALYVMRPMETDTEEGRFTLQDLIDALAEMNRMNASRDAGFRFTMRPSAILRDPERLRDLVLECREKKRRRKRPAPRDQQLATRDAGGVVNRIDEHDPAAEAAAEPLSDAMAEFLRAHKLPTTTTT